ncbi:aspartate-semialdehyde dehydrogenase [Ochrobactrum teleogrylli]|uniref:aspartate-semialdehyde dehydrogenase n=1 Tax=Ochrobactrum teleogrylli TaxID=2479765 RepID=UPI0036390FEC
MSFNGAVGGATGNVGSQMLRILEEREFPIKRLVPLASTSSVGKTVMFRGEALEVGNLATFDFSGIDILFLSTGGENAKITAPRAAAAGCVVIDNSSAFRMDADVPLVVPEVNPNDLRDWNKRRILPVANCSTIQLAVALKPLHDVAGLKRVVISTYQSMSGGGKRLVDRLLAEADPSEVNRLALQAAAMKGADGGEKPFAYNVVPHIDVFLEDGRTKEEWKMESEIRRILNLPDLPVSATCVRVPVIVGHAESVNIELERSLTAKEARKILDKAPGMQVLDEHQSGGYATPLDVAGTDPVWVSRIREDRSVPFGLNMWIVADNVRKGAALNAVQIAEELLLQGALSR